MNSSNIRSRILIVEDEADYVRQLTELLSEANYETVVVHNSDEALAAVHLQQPDLVLIDLAISGCDDIAVLRAMRAVDPELPAIIITRNGSSEEVRAAMLYGAFDFFTRPYGKRELLVSIEEALAIRYAQNVWQEVGSV